MPDFENTPVETVAPDTMNAPAADAQEAVEEVVISAEPSQAPATGSTKKVEGADAPANPPADGAQRSQKDIDAAFGKRFAQERRKFEQTDEYRLGSMILDERAKRDGITKAEAFARIQQERVDATAEEYAKNPKAFYRDYLNAQQRPAPAQESEAETPQAQAKRIGETLAGMHQRGELPDGFDIKALDRDTYANIVEYGAPAAMRIWAAEHGPARELARRQSGPAPMRPTSGASQQSAPTDYSKISTEEWRKKQAEIKRAVLDGKRVRLS